MPSVSDRLPPVIFMGGGSCTCPSLAVWGAAASASMYSLTRTPMPASRATPVTSPCAGWAATAASWKAFLLGPESDYLRGAAVLTGDDAGVELIAHNRERLLEKFLLDDSNPDAQLCMLDKLRTCDAARAAGVPTPRFWRVDGIQDVMRLEKELVFPLMVKPLLSHLFSLRFGKKYFLANDFDQLVGAFRTASEAGISAMLVEMIPGSDQPAVQLLHLPRRGRSASVRFHQTHHPPLSRGHGPCVLSRHRLESGGPRSGVAAVPPRRPARTGQRRIQAGRARRRAQADRVQRAASRPPTASWRRRASISPSWCTAG